jgi:integrase
MPGGLDPGVLPTLSIHGLRHTMASLWLDAGEPVKIVSERLRHSSPSITYDIYSQIIPGSQADAARRMDDRMLGADVSNAYQNAVK